MTCYSFNSLFLIKSKMRCSLAITVKTQIWYKNKHSLSLIVKNACIHQIMKFYTASFFYYSFIKYLYVFLYKSFIGLSISYMETNLIIKLNGFTSQTFKNSLKFKDFLLFLNIQSLKYYKLYIFD